MSSVNKVCAWCGQVFDRRARLSEAQWAARRFCSKQCGASKVDLPPLPVVEAYVSGQAINEIAKRFKVSGTAIKRILTGAGVDMRSASQAIRLSHSKPEFRHACRERAVGRALPESAKQKLRALVGAKNPHWKGGITRHGSGYAIFTKSPENGANAGKLVHRVVVEEQIGRALTPDEHVHHIDFNKTNNDLSNLRVMTAEDHHRLHAVASGLGRSDRA